ncbi:sugar kinase [Herbidospora sp. NBRC 101105]|uniref:carbohydrate kinase family protein n=1 Tax=Herbidospora sp. NBRC 101105 TaxID=3032195 RepID=UPI0024A2DB5A|nr:sugar kinase [Herbidospora sp. NBRC 101105]GLX94188.1 sugar kinase [Herbidospora sp. NBRC 101105]
MTRDMRGLLVIGDVVTDVVALHSEPVATGTDTEADITLRPGGSGANTAAWAAHLGGDARLLARVGADTAAWHLNALSGVKTHVTVDPDRPTAVVIAMVDDAGERSFLTNRGAARRLGPGDWTDALLDGVGCLHLSGYLMWTPEGLELARIAMRAAKDVTVSVDPASTRFLHEFGPERFLAETREADVIIPNRDEALALTGAADPERAAELLGDIYGTAVVKLGPAGALLAQDGRIVARAGAATAGPDDRVVDSTGAGDAFAAGFLTARLAGSTRSECLEAGCRAGRRAVGLIGGRPPAVKNATELYPIDTN